MRQTLCASPRSFILPSVSCPSSLQSCFNPPAPSSGPAQVSLFLFPLTNQDT